MYTYFKSTLFFNHSLKVAVANKYVDYHAEKFGFVKPNTDFRLGLIEKLGEAGIKDNFYDIIV